MFSNVSYYLRPSKDKFKYWTNTNYVYVDDGFFQIRNFFRPTPLGFYLVSGNIIVLYMLYAIVSYGLWKSYFIGVLFANWGLLGIGAGAHRLWAHRSYKASFLLRLFLALAYSSTWQGTLYSWCVSHRIHHKYTDSDADPYNTLRGYFYAHGFFMIKREHPDIQTKVEKHDFKDLKADRIVLNQEKYYVIWVLVTSFLVPMLLDMYLTGNTLMLSYGTTVMIRLFITTHNFLLLNSAAHMFGDKPHNPKTTATNNIFTDFFTYGDGNHNYHHYFPLDYRSSESIGIGNISAHFINLCVLLGLASDRRFASDKSIKNSRIKALKTSLQES